MERQVITSGGRNAGRTHAHKFNLMLETLRKISKGYMTPEKLRKNCEKEYGLEFEECIEMVYENIQADAAFAIKGIRPILKTGKEIKEPISHAPTNSEGDE